MISPKKRGSGVLLPRAVGMFFFCLPLFSCGSRPPVRETPLPAAPVTGNDAPAAGTASHSSSGGVAEDIRSLIEAGTSASLMEALELIRARDVGNSEFGRVMTAVAAALFRKVYHDTPYRLPSPDPPQNHPYARILREGEAGNYVRPTANSTDYLEYVLPFLSFLPEGSGKIPGPERAVSVLPDLLRAGELNSHSVLAPYFLGLVYERAGEDGDAAGSYRRAYALSAECYPAALGLARVLIRNDGAQEAIRLLLEMVIRYPDNGAIKRQLALAYYENRDWSRAEPAIAEILQRDSRDGQFILMRAHILVEQGQFMQAQAPLDLYGSIDANNRLYLFLRARVQAEGYRNRDAALSYLRSLLRLFAGDEEAAVYAVRLFLESPRREDQNEGRELLQRLLRDDRSSLTVVNLALQDAVRREAWREAQPYLDRLLRERRSVQDLLNAYRVERGLGNNAAALAPARELYERDPTNDEGGIAYISALIDTGRQDEAARILEARLGAVGGGSVKSRYFYLRSRIRTGEDAVMNDLRSSLFEDPRNLDALIAMFEIYQRRRDERRAVYYLKQALALSPDNPLLRRYETEYAALLGN